MNGWECLLCVLILLPLFICPCCASCISDPVIIAKSDSARYNSIALDNNTIAWIEYGPNNIGISRSSIHKFDIPTGRHETVIVDPSGKFSLDISDSRYVWSDQRGIFFYDEKKNLLTFLYSEKNQYNPVIDGDIIVWEERTKDRSYLRMYDLSTGEYRDVAPQLSTHSECYLPAISGDRIVFVSKNRMSEEINLVLCNLTTGELKNVARLLTKYHPPSIDGDTIVWTGDFDDYYSVYMYNISRKTKSVISPKTGYQMYPDVSGEHVVWVYYGQGGGMMEDGGIIYLYNVRTGNASVISQEGEFQDFPKVSGSYTVWTDRGGDENDIYLYGIPGEMSGLVRSQENITSLPGPTPDPTPDTKVRFYSSIEEGEVQWYSLAPPPGSSQISLELRWRDPDDEISVSVVSPEGSVWRFSDEDDQNDDSSIRMTIAGINTAYSLKSKWTIAVSGDIITGNQSYYDVCWY